MWRLNDQSIVVKLQTSYQMKSYVGIINMTYYSNMYDYTITPIDCKQVLYV